MCIAKGGSNGGSYDQSGISRSLFAKPKKISLKIFEKITIYKYLECWF
jgi:hypothetical protein